MKIQHLGVIPYSAALDIQRQYFESLIASSDLGQEVLLLCEHMPVYTLGRSGDANNMLVNEDFLSSIGATYLKTDRGGDITYHGYGQLVSYPILNLTRRSLSLKDYIYELEQVIIDVVGAYGVSSERLAGATGVWVEGRRKIAAIGVKASRFITMHGSALNVNTDLSYFEHINPCGFIDRAVTSLQAELGREIDMAQVEILFSEKFMERFGG